MLQIAEQNGRAAAMSIGYWIEPALIVSCEHIDSTSLRSVRHESMRVDICGGITQPVLPKLNEDRDFRSRSSGP